MIERIFGAGTDLDALQMSARALALFFVALALVRIGGMRAFGARSPFDTIVGIMLGAVLSRGVVGASPVIATIAACAVIAVVHRGLAVLSSQWTWLARLLNGRPRVVYREGAPVPRAMRMHGVSARDLEQAARREVHAPRAGDVDEIWLETSGDLSVVKRDR